MAELTCLEFASSRFHSHREAALRSQQVRWCWHPEAAVHAGRGTGLGSAWLALHSAAAPAAAGADWPARALHNVKRAACRQFQQRRSRTIRNQRKTCSVINLLQAP